MANQKISALTSASTPLAGTEVLPIVQSGTTVKVSVDNLTTGKAVSGTQFTASTGNFIVGTAGKGIDFSANSHAAGMTSELLTWYEEGTWTPTATFSVSQGDLTYDTRSGRYTRIGRVVQANCFVRFTETTASGNLTITGLPFTSSGALSTAAGCFVDNLSGVSGAVVAQLNASSSTITLYYTATGNSTQLSNTNTGTNSSFQFALMYIV